jgi:hypothetical protein
VPPPWPRFAADLERALTGVRVSRLEICKGRGEGHRATIYRRSVDKDRPTGRVQERRSIDLVTDRHLALLDPVRQRDLITAVRDWRGQDRKARPPYPRMPQKGQADAGPEIRHLRLPIVMNGGIELGGGLVANGDMVRVDVFKSASGFWLVPIYAHQVANRQRWSVPPTRACVANRSPGEWVELGPEAVFRFSLHRWSFLHLENRRGEILEGYFRGMNISVASIMISPHDDSRAEKIRNVGVKRLRVFRKDRIDLLGKLSAVRREPRLWHGRRC